MDRRRRNRGLEYGVILLLMELFNLGLSNIPPVTLVSILGQVALYSGFVNVPWDKWDVCLSAREVMKGRDYRRLFLSAFEHGDDMHLYYNMLSFLIKGRSLERKMGSKNFICVLAFLTTLTSCYYVGLGWAMHHLTNDKYYVTVCAVGFSGVIFALKVLTSEYQDVGMRYAVWTELILIYLLVPGSSFMGHLAGILAGLTFSKTRIGKYFKKAIERLTGDRVDGHYQGESSSRQSFSGSFGDAFRSFGFQQGPTYGFRGNPGYSNTRHYPNAGPYPNSGPSYGWNVN